MDNPYDRAAENLGNIPGSSTSTSRSRPGSGERILPDGAWADTRPLPGTNNMWVVVGRTSQFHMLSGEALVLRGVVGVVIPDRTALLARLESVKVRLKGTKFSYKATNDYVEATCPWGNRFHLYTPDSERFGPINLGILYVEFDVPTGSERDRAVLRGDHRGQGPCRG